MPVKGKGKKSGKSAAVKGAARKALNRAPKKRAATAANAAEGSGEPINPGGDL
jgi:hypothetical protein